MAAFDTLADEARKSAAVTAAYTGWVEDLEENPPAPTMSPDPGKSSEYPANAFLVDASPAQLADLQGRVQTALNDSEGGDGNGE